MTGTPGRFKRVAAAFNEAYSRVRLCDSSGSEHDPLNDHDVYDLSVLVKEYLIEGDRELLEFDAEEKRSFDDETKQNLEDLLYKTDNNEGNEVNGDLEIRKKIRGETELACSIVGDRFSFGFKRKLMSYLRGRGFDAGLCKTRWERFGRHPGGDYEYVDVNIDGNRYMVEVCLAEEFEIARASSQYTSLLDVFPRIFVAKPEELTRIVRLMCNAIKESMKGRGIHVPPWRRHRYMQAKWFGQYKRTVNETPTTIKELKPGSCLAAKCSIGFEAYPVKSYHCRDDFASEYGQRVGYLTTILNGNGINTRS